MKPDDIPQWAWDKADETWRLQTQWEGDRIVVDNITPIACALIEARSQAFEEIDRLIGEANARLGGIETPAMRGDNLAVTLCTHFDDGEPSDDETGWSPAAIDGYEQVMDAIKDHYSQAIRQHSQKRRDTE